MVSIGNVKLEIFEGPPTTSAGFAIVRVSYQITATHHDAQHEQSYRELVRLIGVDTGPGEDGKSEILIGGTIWDGVVVFSTSQVSFTQIHEKQLATSVLDEDSGPGPIRRDEIRARVTLSPIPPASSNRESNLVTRGEPIIAGG
jgi:hypothetical protein